MTLGKRHTDLKINLEMIVLSVIIFCAFVSFLVGFLLREDSIGGARFDFYLFHWPAIELFSSISWSTAAADYGGAANNPLLYVIASLLPLHGDEKIYHVITFVAALLTWPLLSWAYYRRYSNHEIDWLWASFGASTILISPSFRSSAFWGTTDYLPFVFCAATSLLLSRFQDDDGNSKQEKGRTIGLFTLVALAATSASAFYTRQLYAFVPFFAAWMVLRRTDTSSFLVFSIFLVAMLPEMFLVYLWKGINPPVSKSAHVFHPSMINVLGVGANIGLVSIPLVLGCIRRSLADVLPEWWERRSTVITFVGLLVFITALRGTEWPELGGGIIVKAGLRMGAFGTPFVLTVSYFGFVSAILLSVRSLTNALLVGSFVVPFFVVRESYQHYLEPSLVVTLFLFADTRTAKTLFNKRVLTYNFLFSALLLTIAILYYDLFNHLSKIPR
jgi:hypothetical protein